MRAVHGQPEDNPAETNCAAGRNRCRPGSLPHPEQRRASFSRSHSTAASRCGVSRCNNATQNGGGCGSAPSGAPPHAPPRSPAPSRVPHSRRRRPAAVRRATAPAAAGSFSSIRPWRHAEQPRHGRPSSTSDAAAAPRPSGRPRPTDVNSRRLRPADDDGPPRQPARPPALPPGSCRMTCGRPPSGSSDPGTKGDMRRQRRHASPSPRRHGWSAAPCRRGGWPCGGRVTTTAPASRVDPQADAAGAGGTPPAHLAGHGLGRRAAGPAAGKGAKGDNLRCGLVHAPTMRRPGSGFQRLDRASVAGTSGTAAGAAPESRPRCRLPGNCAYM